MASQRQNLLNSYPKSVDEIYDILSESTGKSREVLKTITAFPFIFTRDMIRNGEHRAILLHNLGSFETYLTSVNREISNVIKGYRNGKVTRARAASAISTLWKLRVNCQEQMLRRLNSLENAKS